MTATTTSSTRRKRKHKHKHHKSRQDSSRAKSRSSTEQPEDTVPVPPTGEEVVAEGPDESVHVGNLDSRAAAPTVSPQTDGLMIQHREAPKIPVGSDLAPPHDAKKHPETVEQHWKPRRRTLRDSQHKGIPRARIVGFLHLCTPPSGGWTRGATSSTSAPSASSAARSASTRCPPVERCTLLASPLPRIQSPPTSSSAAARNMIGRCFDSTVATLHGGTVGTPPSPMEA